MTGKTSLRLMKPLQDESGPFTPPTEWHGDGASTSTFHPGPLDRFRTFHCWTRDMGDDAAHNDHMVYGAVSLDDAIAECVRELDEDEPGFDEIVTEGPVVRAVIRIRPEGTTVERFDA